MTIDCGLIEPLKKNEFQLNIPDIDLILDIQVSNFPSVDTSAIQSNHQGYHVPQTASTIIYSKLSFTFRVNSNLQNYKTLLEWSKNNVHGQKKIVDCFMLISNDRTAPKIIFKKSFIDYLSAWEFDIKSASPVICTGRIAFFDMVIE